MIKLKDLSCGYGSKVVLSDVNLMIYKGELTCILGKNGTGKTTLFKTILGLLPSINGSIFYHDKPIKHHTHKQIASYISYVPQAHSTPFPYSVIDVVLMGQYIHTNGFIGKPNKRNKEIAYHCLKVLGAEKLTYKNFSKISGGEKQLVLIARAMAQQPKFIAMDEPTANLDMGNSLHVMKVAHKLKKQGYGVIMNTHSPEQAFHFADKVIMLKNGTVSSIGNTEEVLKADALSDLYNTPIELVEALTSSGEIKKLLVAL